MAIFNPTRTEIIAALRDIRYEIEALLQNPKHDPRDESIVETVYFRKMAHARALHTFFTGTASKRHKRDVLSEDYLFPAAPIYSDDKSQSLIDRFNQDLFHISYSRLQRTSADTAWPMEEMLPPIIDRSKRFMAHLLALEWQDIPPTELQKWRDMQDKRFVFRHLAQSTLNIADSQIASVEIHVRGI
jgi:hypothetical protein